MSARAGSGAPPRAAMGAIDVAAARGLGRFAPRVRRTARRALDLLGASAAELSVALVGDEEMRALNRDYRGKDRPTDVLAFAQREGEPAPAVDAASPAAPARPDAGARGARAGRPGAAVAPVAAPELLGDVVISIPTARRQADERGRSLEAELDTLLVHGILHLLGYDHERSPAEARRMFAKARAVEAALGAAPPTPAARRSRAARTRTRSPGPGPRRRSRGRRRARR